MAIDSNKIKPKHIAIVMDGNGRWAKAKKMPRIVGHQRGVKTVRKIITSCIDQKVDYLTLFAFSSENWKRPAEEVTGLMSLFITALDRESKSMIKNGICLKVVGDLSKLPRKLQAKIDDVETLTRQETRLNLIVAANYGGRWDIVEAAKKITKKILAGDVDVNKLDADMVTNHLVSKKIPDPDLFIRTGGEKRISNFLLWQLAYAELYFTDTLWPEFNQKELIKAIDDFSHRQRRFGMTGDQVKEGRYA